MFALSGLQKIIFVVLGVITPAGGGAVATRFLFNNKEDMQKLEHENKEQGEKISKLDEELKNIQDSGTDKAQYWQNALKKEEAEKIVLTNRKSCLNDLINYSSSISYFQYKMENYKTDECEKKYPIKTEAK